MKKCKSSLCTVLAVTLLGVSQPASSCSTADYLIRVDYAAADLVFEGKIKALHPTFTEYDRGGKIVEQVTGLDVTFDVEKLIRGKQQGPTLRVSWIHGTFGYPKSLDDLHDSYRGQVRVGLITPAAMIDDCSRNDYSKPDEVTDIIKIKCKRGYVAYKSKDPRAGLPANQAFILNGFCTGPYMFPTTSLRDDPTRDLSKFIIGDEGFQFENGAEVEYFYRYFVSSYPDIAASYEDKQSSQDFFVKELLLYANISPDSTDAQTQEIVDSFVQGFEGRREWFIETEKSKQKFLETLLKK